MCNYTILADVSLQKYRTWTDMQTASTILGEACAYTLMSPTVVIKEGLMPVKCFPIKNGIS